jgi:hypothetical protein
MLKCIGFVRLGALIFILMLSGCDTIQALIDIDKPLAPNDLHWTKNGASKAEKQVALRECAAKMLKASSDDEMDVHDICMLKKGYRFVPKPGDYPNVCLYTTFKNSVACKSARGEIKVEADPLAPADSGSHSPWTVEGKQPIR